MTHFQEETMWFGYLQEEEVQGEIYQQGYVGK